MGGTSSTGQRGAGLQASAGWWATGKPKKPAKPKVWVPLLLPSFESGIRAGIERLFASTGVRPQVAGEIDDMAMMRLLARESREGGEAQQGEAKGRPGILILFFPGGGE